MIRSNSYQLAATCRWGALRLRLWCSWTHSFTWECFNDKIKEPLPHQEKTHGVQSQKQSFLEGFVIKGGSIICPLTKNWYFPSGWFMHHLEIYSTSIQFIVDSPCQCCIAVGNYWVPTARWWFEACFIFYPSIWRSWTFLTIGFVFLKTNRWFSCGLT